MRKKLFLLLLISCILSCTKEDQDCVVPNAESVQPVGLFSRILSSAVSNNLNLRAFIKKEALKQFDKDYDVFYPIVKDAVIYNGKTFKDCLLPYSDNEELQKIEESLPLLNIYVPDYSWLGAFNPKTWDVSDNEIAVGYKNGKSIMVFSNGMYEGALAEDEYPDFPILLIKNNERLRCSKRTKSSGYEYEYIDDVFDGRQSETKTKVEWKSYYDDLYDLEAPNGFVGSDELDSRVIDAYNEFKGDDYKYQRDYIYFGLTNT